MDAVGEVSGCERKALWAAEEPKTRASDQILQVQTVASCANAACDVRSEGEGEFTSVKVNYE